MHSTAPLRVLLLPKGTEDFGKRFAQSHLYLQVYLVFGVWSLVFGAKAGRCPLGRAMHAPTSFGFQSLHAFSFRTNSNNNTQNLANLVIRKLFTFIKICIIIFMK